MICHNNRYRNIWPCHVTPQRRACAALSRVLFGAFHSRIAPALAGAAHAEPWRRFSEGRYQRSLYSETNDQGSISSVLPNSHMCHTNVGSPIAANCVPGPSKSRRFSGLAKALVSSRAGYVKSLDTYFEAIATTPCNAHGAETICTCIRGARGMLASSAENGGLIVSRKSAL